MSKEKAESRSVSMLPTLWGKVEMVCDLDKSDRSQYFQGLVLSDLRMRGLDDGAAGFDNLIAMIREAQEVGVPVVEVFAREISKRNEVEVIG